MNMGFAGTNATINAASTGNLLCQKDLQSGMQSCCCDIKSSILNQTNQLQSQVAQLANGVQTGFAKFSMAFFILSLIAALGWTGWKIYRKFFLHI